VLISSEKKLLELRNADVEGAFVGTLGRGTSRAPAAGGEEAPADVTATEDNDRKWPLYGRVGGG